MDNADAERLALMLLTAFPSPRVKPADVELWADYLGRLQDRKLAEEVIDGLILGHEERRPTVAYLMRSYRVAKQREEEALARERGLPEAQVEPGPEHALAVMAGFDRMPTEEVGPFTAGMRAYFEGIAGIAPNGTSESPAEEVEADAGKCADCKRPVKVRRRYGQTPQEDGSTGLALCARCYGARGRIARELEQPKATAGPAPRLDPEAGPAEGGEAEA